MQGNFGKSQRGQENLANRRGDLATLDLEADWNYLRANLDHPAHRLGNRLGSGLAEWLLRRLHANSAPAPQLSILARIALGPRQTLALVEAEGVHLLVGTSADGPPSFFALHDRSGATAERSPISEAPTDAAAWSGAAARISAAAQIGAAGRILPGRHGASGASGTQTGLAHPIGRPTARLRLAGRVSWV